MGDLLTITQAAERLGTSPRFPRRLVSERRITFVKIGRHVRIPSEAIEQLIAENTIDPTAPLWPSGQLAP